MRSAVVDIALGPISQISRLLQHVGKHHTVQWTAAFADCESWRELSKEVVAVARSSGLVVQLAGGGAMRTSLLGSLFALMGLETLHGLGVVSFPWSSPVEMWNDIWPTIQFAINAFSQIIKIWS